MKFADFRDRRQRAGGAPEHVAQHDRRPERQRDQPPDSLRPEELQDDHAGNHDETGDEVGLQIDGKRHQQEDQSSRDAPKGHDETLFHQFSISVRFSLRHMPRISQGIRAVYG